MPALIQFCIVIVTVGLLALAVITLSILNRFLDKASADLSQLTLSIRDSAAQLDLVARDSRALVASLGACVSPISRVVDRFEAVGHRTADLSTALLEEIELPVLTAAAVVRGVKSGAGHFVKLLMHRSTHRHSPINGDQDNE